MTTLLVITNLPDRDGAEKLAAELIERRVAACVNVLVGCRSVYRWKGQVEHADEFPVFIKTTADAYPHLERLIRERHPYELPEIIAVRIERGLASYLDWVVAETGEPGPA
ncbi:divalent-cation tolerance protein CutA [Pelomicrobium methylotrophicum]|uniref:Divalent-cation tolerance protein CutA n=1 Tax=Pelomicrobium methylotrophicum TaxID=2602750 RepID=A0A5C7ERF6_9PROT|nr:divalent-cation tolerance protein CutA [Pelomicrobium methylotrophicum]TXF10815.1 divalent-cation tolerance protein CutA [Pelomicrobium methylotrophicum]